MSNLSGIQVFIVHGRDKSALKVLLSWFRRRGVSIEPITFEQLAILGEPIPAELERITTLGDAAVILATPDDFGRLGTEISEKPRARENVWVELGWFWARLGRRRTLLLLRGKVEPPSDLSGILYLRYQKSLREVSKRLQEFLQSLVSSEPDSLTEVVRVASDPHKRSWEYRQVFETSRNLVVITGIGMINIRQNLPAILNEMSEKRTDLRLEFVLIDKNIFNKYDNQYEGLLAQIYRPNLIKDISNFENDLASLLKENPKLNSRIRLYRYNGLMPFSATVADPPQWGSLMLVETILPRNTSHLVERPRLMLRRRCAEGLYDRYWKSIETMKNKATPVKVIEI